MLSNITFSRAFTTSSSRHFTSSLILNINNNAKSNNFFSILGSLLNDGPKNNNREDVYQASTSPSGVPISKFLSVNFPLTFKQSFKDYKIRNNLYDIQNELLSLLNIHEHSDIFLKTIKTPIYMDKSTGKIIHHDKISKPGVQIDKSNYINEVCFHSKDIDPNDPNVNHLVMIHGYGAGLGFFIKNLQALMNYVDDKNKKWCIHAIDLLGYGTSSRPEINYNYNNNISAFEKWFSDSLESWRLQRNLIFPEKNLIMAHSLGAYLSICYNINYPMTFKKLLLVSPAGIIKPRNFDYKKIPSWFNYLWDLNVSPFALVRYSGPLGSFFVSGWSSRRFSKLSEKEHDALHKYSYGIFNAKGSGEYFLTYVLGAGGVPRHPLVDNIEKVEKINCETEWIYGDKDWMDFKGGEIMKNKLINNNKLTSGLTIFKNCGHHVYLDDYHRFNEYLVNQLESFK